MADSKVVFELVSPERLLVGMEKRWSSFRRGTTPSLVRLVVSVRLLALSLLPSLNGRKSGKASRLASD